MSGVAASAAPLCLPKELALLERLAVGLPRSEFQCNQRHESDAELIRLPVLASGPLGRGSAYAFARLLGDDTTAPAFQPRPRMAEGQLVRRYASCCMDTSHGLITTLDELSRLNGVGFALSGVETLLHPAALPAAQAAGLPAWFMLPGPHGEFELVFTIPQAQMEAFRADAHQLGWQPTALGAVSPNPQTTVLFEGRRLGLDTRAIRDAFADASGDPADYLARLAAIHEAMTAGAVPPGSG